MHELTWENIHLQYFVNEKRSTIRFIVLRRKRIPPFIYGCIVIVRKYSCFVLNYNTCINSLETILICNIILIRKWLTIQFMILRMREIPPFIYGCIISVRNYTCYVLNYNTRMNSRETMFNCNIILKRKWSTIQSWSWECEKFHF